jgi:hypothetical protein
MTAFPIHPTVPVVVAPTPLPIYPALDYGFKTNAALNGEFHDHGPSFILRKYILPAVEAGWARQFFLRHVPMVGSTPQPDWEWLHSWEEAANNLGVWPILYVNPIGWTPQQAERIRTLRASIALEFTGQLKPESWVRGYLADRVEFVEPGIEKTDALVPTTRPMILTDYEVGKGWPPGASRWVHLAQVEPDGWPAGWLGWKQDGFADLSEWWKARTAHKGFKGAIIAADAARLGWSAAKIRGAA